MNIHELKEQDSARFNKEYWEWVKHQGDYEWWDCLEEGFKEDMKPLGVEIEKIHFRLNFSQGDYASFRGYIDFPSWLQTAGYAEQYPALVLAASDYGVNQKVLDRYDAPRVDWDFWYAVGTNTEPSGVFEMLDQDTWCELIESQMDAEDWEKLINDWLSGHARELYDKLRKEYEYLTSEEEFIEYCENNEATFDDETEEE